MRVWGGVQVIHEGRESLCFSLHLESYSPEDGGQHCEKHAERQVCGQRKKEASWARKQEGQIRVPVGVSAG